MPRIEIPVVDDLITLNVAIAPKGRDEAERGYRAIFDTGTQMTAISTRVVDQVSPDVVSEAQLRVADGTERWTPVLWVRMRVLLGLTATEAPAYDILATQIPTPLEGCDVLVGMDIIKRWHVTLGDGRCIIEL